MAHAHYMLDTEGYTYTLKLCNTYCFSTATIVARMHLIVTLYVQCLSCWYYQRFNVLEVCHFLAFQVTIYILWRVCYNEDVLYTTAQMALFHMKVKGN